MRKRDEVSGLAIASIIGTVANITNAPDNVVSITEASLQQTSVGGATGPAAFSAAMRIAKAGPSRIICELIAGQKGNDHSATQLIQNTERLFTFGNSIADDINKPINEATNKVERLFKNMKTWFQGVSQAQKLNYPSLNSASTTRISTATALLRSHQPITLFISQNRKQDPFKLKICLTENPFKNLT